MFEDFDWIGAMRTSPVMLVILCCSVITFGFAIERSLYFWKRRHKPDQMLARVAEQVRAGSMKEALWTCGSAAHPVGPVAAQVLRSLDEPADVQEERLQIALSEQRLQLDRHLGILGTMGNTAPLIGLLGTVWGIM